MTYMIKKLGWLPDALDPRDFTPRQPQVEALLKRTLPALSVGGKAGAGRKSGVGELKVDLRQWCPPVEDQGQVGSCTANAVVGAHEYLQKKLTGAFFNASRFFLYRVTRRLLGWEGRGDTGAFIRSTIKALRLFGVPPEEYWPYNEQDFDREPEAFHYSFAQNFRALQYFRLEESISQLKSVLDSGLPFAFGFSCFASMFTQEVNASGIIPYPTVRDEQKGGHAVLAVGYTDSHLLIRNSWGTGWGEEGYGYLPWTYFDRDRPLATDCWSLVNESLLEEAPAARRSVARVPEAAAAREKEARPVITPLIRVVRGTDPIKHVPVRLSASGVAHDGEQLRIGLDSTTRSLSLNLRRLRLKKSFDFSLLGKATNEIYLLALAWDLSGKEPVLYPRPNQIDQMKGVFYPMENGGEIQFVGEGLALWPNQQVQGALFINLLLLESDKDVRALGEQLAQLHGALKESELVSQLATLAKNPTAAAIVGAGAAAVALMGAFSSVLQRNGDDLVALFEGTYGVDSLLTGRTDVVDQQGAAVELELKVERPQKGVERPRLTALQQVLSGGEAPALEAEQIPGERRERLVQQEAPHTIM